MFNFRVFATHGLSFLALLWVFLVLLWVFLVFCYDIITIAVHDSFNDFNGLRMALRVFADVAYC